MSIRVVSFKVTPVCRDLADPLDGRANCQSFPYKFCSVSCNNNKVLFNATGNYASRLWVCLSAQWTPTDVLPDCVGYVDSNGLSCPHGKVLIKTTLEIDAATIVNVCGDCPSGTYYENNECKLCPPGTYQQETGKSGPAACTKCPDGTSSKPGTRKFSGCQAICAPGFFSADGFQPCELCELGEYQDSSGAISCERCPSDRRCTRHQGAVSLLNCGPCPLISHIEPSGNVKRLRGSLLQLFCYVNTTGGFNIRWAFVMDKPGQTVGNKVYQKDLRDDNGKKIGLKLSVRDLQASANYECVMENQYALVKKAVHVSVIDSQGAGSGAGLVNDEMMYEAELLDV